MPKHMVNLNCPVAMLGSECKHYWGGAWYEHNLAPWSLKGSAPSISNRSLTYIELGHRAVYTRHHTADLAEITTKVLLSHVHDGQGGAVCTLNPLRVIQSHSFIKPLEEDLKAHGYYSEFSSVSQQHKLVPRVLSNEGGINWKGRYRTLISWYHIWPRCIH